MINSIQMKRVSRLASHKKLEVLDLLTKLCEFEPDENMYSLLRKVVQFKNPTLSTSNPKQSIHHRRNNNSYIDFYSDEELIKSIGFYLKIKYGVSNV